MYAPNEEDDIGMDSNFPSPDDGPEFSTDVLDSQYLSHLNNLLRKELIAATPLQTRLVAEAQAGYTDYLSRIDYQRIASGDADVSVAALEEYLGLAKRIETEDPMFNWRSGFAGSVIPEFLYRVTHVVLAGLGLDPVFSTNDSVVELLPAGAGGWTVRKKNQDLCIGVERMSVATPDGVADFVVPLVACEVKTNTDINKLSGLNFSAESLKRSFPTARYFIATETVDFSLDDNYVAGSVDEIYVLRKTVRSIARRVHVELAPDVFAAMLDDFISIIEKARRTAGHVYDRLDAGKLING